MVAAALAVFASGLAIFLAPGAVLLAAASISLRPLERIAYSFTASLVLLTAAFALSLALGLSLGGAGVALLSVTTAAGLLMRFCFSADSIGVADDNVREEDPSRLAGVAIVFLLIFCLAAAVAFAPVGSVDRWWYLAYVRSFLQADALTLAEPFFGTGQAFARFGVHPWLFGLALWSQWSSVDPVLLYERAAPIVAVMAAFSSTVVLARELFSDRATARLSVLATMLLWSGGLVPVLARGGEDKILAASALTPLCIAACLRLLRSPCATRVRQNLLLLLLAATATAATHALAYAFVLLALIPTALVLGFRGAASRGTLILAASVLLVVAVAPATTGFVVQQRLQDIGAEQRVVDHPVVRVHQGRERLMALPGLGNIVSPRLLLHPLVLLAALGVLGLMRSRSRIRGDAGSFLTVATVLPLFLAYIPPLPVAVGAVIPPWMVYRVLWLLPLAPLAALGAIGFASRIGKRELAGASVMLLLGLPMVVWNAQSRGGETRALLAAPSNEEFAGLLRAIVLLPNGSLVAAPPELSERLPALTGRPVLAALDRSTIVFSGSRTIGESRLRSRAMALLSGPTMSAALEDIAPTYAVFAPGAEEGPNCVVELYRAKTYALCELAAPSPKDSKVPVLSAAVPADSSADGLVREATCITTTRQGRRNPWSANTPLARCRVSVPATWQGRAGVVLQVETNTGRAADELLVRVASGKGGRPLGDAVARVSGRGRFAWELPPLESADLEVRIASAFLPTLRVPSVSLKLQKNAGD